MSRWQKICVSVSPASEMSIELLSRHSNTLYVFSSQVTRVNELRVSKVEDLFTWYINPPPPGLGSRHKWFASCSKPITWPQSWLSTTGYYNYFATAITNSMAHPFTDNLSLEVG